MKTLEIPSEFHNYTNKQLITFLRRGKYDVEYRKARNERIKLEQEEFKKWKEDRK